ncbi:hypothetical protein [uncultured Dokdonia sp.]|uniref:hypothetical protein n=1 Tax=uncultured Dokdonia sp. TaxID=575653 RepID=UPI0026081E57|nr:hypothetical protein [uncultured Dokdonia sp.]
MNDFIIEDDLEIKNGDFRIDEASQQNLTHILLSQKGSFKEYPILGVGLTRYLNSPDSTARLRLENEIDKQLIYDNFNVRALDVNDLKNIKIDGNY